MTPSAAWGLALGLAAAVYDPLTRAADSKALGVGLVVLTLVALRLPQWRRAMAWPRAALALLLGVTSLSLSWSAHPSLAPLFPWAIASAIGLAVPRDEAPTTAAYAAAALVTTEAGLRLAGLPAGGAGNANWLGLPLVLALPALLEASRTSAHRWPWLALAATAGALVLGSRAAVVGLLVAVAVTARRRAVTAALLGVVLLAGLFQRGAIRDALAGRLHIWSASLQDVRPHGHGAGSFGWVYREGQGALLRPLSLPEAASRYVPARSAHHDLIQVTVESGWLGATLLLVVLLGLVLLLEREGRLAALALTTAGLADVPLQLPASAVFLGLLVARLPDPAPSPSARSFVLPGAIAIALVTLVAEAAPRWWFQRQLSAWQAQPAPAPEALVPLAARDPEARLALAATQLDLAQPRAALRSLEPAPVPDLGVMLLRGRAYLQLNQPELAARAFRGALHRHPALVRGWLGLAESERRAGALDRADAALDALVPLLPHDSRVAELREQLRRDRIEAETQHDVPP